MFESVLERNVPPRQIGRGAALAVGVHAVLLLAGVFLSSRPTRLVEKEIHAVTVFTPSSKLAPASGAPGERGSASTPPRTEQRASRPLRTDADKNRKRVEEPSSSAATHDDASHAIGDPGPSADETTARGGGGGVPGGTGAGGGPTIAIPFGDGMQRPMPIAQPAPVYSREASAARSEGTASVRCVITVEGTLKDCRIARGVPFMDAAVLEALSRWKYTPVMFQGRPVSVYYSINLRLIAP